MDSNDVLEILDSLWFFSNIFIPPYNVISSTSNDGEETATNVDQNQLTESSSSVPQKLKDMVDSWMDDAVEAGENDDEDLEQSKVIAMAMSGTANDNVEELPPPVTDPNRNVNSKSKNSKKKVMSVKNVLIERRRNDLKQVEFDSFHGFRRSYRNSSYSPDELFYGPWYRKQQTLMTGFGLREPLRSWNLTAAN